MIICPNCKTGNDEDAKFCKNCGYYFLEETENKNNKDKKNKKENKNKVKQKTKTKNKTKTKIKKEKPQSKKYVQYNDKPRSSIFTKVLLLFFILLSLGLIAIVSILGYNYYMENNIEVPNVIGYSYEEATRVLDNANLSYEMKEEETTNQDEVGIVIKQNKKAGSKTHENAVITLTVGILDNHVIIPNITDMSLEEATTILNKNGITYKIEYKETDKKENNTVINQSIKANKKIENTEVLTITVARNNNSNNENTTDNNETQEENKEETPTNEEIQNEN